MRTVLLTADMIPLRHIPVEEAIIKIVKGSVYAVENHPSRVFRSQHMEIPAPLMVASYRHVSLPDHFYGPATLTNENLFVRDDYECGYCGSSEDLTRDHILPVSQGGKNKWNNVVSACHTCNSKKADILPKYNEMGRPFWEAMDGTVMMLDHVPYEPKKINIIRKKLERKYNINN